MSTAGRGHRDAGIPVANCTDVNPLRCGETPLSCAATVLLQRGLGNRI